MEYFLKMTCNIYIVQAVRLCIQLFEVTNTTQIQHSYIHTPYTIIQVMFIHSDSKYNITSNSRINQKMKERKKKKEGNH